MTEDSSTIFTVTPTTTQLNAYNTSFSGLTYDSFADLDEKHRYDVDVEFSKELIVQDVKFSDMIKRINKVEERLGIINRNYKLEDEWDQLKRLGEEYKRLENELLEKKQSWELLKK